MPNRGITHDGDSSTTQSRRTPCSRRSMTGSGSDVAVVYDDNLLGAAWSPDGTRFADVEGGDKRGIWTYAANAATTPGKEFV